MRIRIDHRTTYRYGAPASSLVQALRVTPAEHAGQHVIDWRVDADIDGSFHHSRDAFGNRVTMFYADGPVSEVTVIVTGLAEIMDMAGVIQADETLPPGAYLRATELTRPDPGIEALAARFADKAPLEAMHGLCASIYNDMRFEVGLTGIGTSAGDALAAGHGVCQDFAHIFAAAARRLNIPARYVSGHLAREEAQEAAHAWAEAYVPELGWVGFDPANGISPTDHYLRVAIGLDYFDAAPIRGARRGGGQESLSVSVDAGAAMRQSQS